MLHTLGGGRSAAVHIEKSHGVLPQNWKLQNIKQTKMQLNLICN